MLVLFIVILLGIGLKLGGMLLKFRVKFLILMGLVGLVKFRILIMLLVIINRCLVLGLKVGIFVLLLLVKLLILLIKLMLLLMVIIVLEIF